MQGLKIFNAVNAALYSIYGLVGVFMPSIVFNANALQPLGAHGFHSIRALWGAVCVLGIFTLLKGLKPETARATTQIVTFVSLGLITARLLGAALDGTEGMLDDQWGPFFIEGAMTLIGGTLLWRTKS